MARYYQTPDGYIAVTGETPSGPLRGLVFVGRGPKPGGGPETVHEQAFSKDQFGTPLDLGQVPDAWLEALGYDWPRPAFEVGVNFLPGLFEPKLAPTAKWRLWPVALGLTLYIVSVLIFWWLKRHG